MLINIRVFTVNFNSLQKNINIHILLQIYKNREE